MLNRGSHLSAIIDEVLWLKPHSILDVGIGWGLFGVIFRAFTDVRKSKLFPENWSTKIDGIEIFEPYKNKAWEFYNNVYIGNALEVIEPLEKYDFVYCGDMIEHLTKEDGYKLIDKMLQHTNKWVHIATPMPAREQGEILGNLSETHLSSWTEEGFNRYKYEKVGIFGWGQDYMLCVRLQS